MKAAIAGAGALGTLGVGEHRDERRLVCHEGDHVVRVCRDERESGHRPTAAREHLDRANAEGLHNGVHVIRLDRGRVVDPAVFAGAAANSARVVGDHGSLREMRRQRIEAAGGHGLADHEQRWAPVGAGH